MDHPKGNIINIGKMYIPREIDVEKEMNADILELKEMTLQLVQ